MSTNGYVLPQYINPQHTEKLYEHQLEQCYSTSRAPTALSSSSMSTPMSNSRSLTIAPSDTSTYATEPSSASSIGSSAGYLTPCSSSNASSRRHSLIAPDSQQYFLSTIPQTPHSPTPGPRRMNNRRIVEQNSSPLNGSFTSYTDSLCSPSHSLASDSFRSSMAPNELLMDVSMYQNKINNVEWQYGHSVGNQTAAFDHSLQMNVPCLGMDLAAGFDASMSNHMDLPRESVDNPPMHAFHSTPTRQRAIHSHGQHTHLPALAEPFEPLSRRSTRSSRSGSTSTSSSPRPRRRSALRGIRRSKVSKEAEPMWRDAFSTYLSSDKKYQCPECTTRFKRPEHLKRHRRKHLPPEETTMISCHFEECGKEIKDRPDNMRAHLQTTHFSYGKTERGGKNRRFSMKESMEKGLHLEDARWALLLDDRLEFGNTKTNYWRMLGYSIKETKDLKVKDLVPGWEGSDEATLKDFDPRWKQLLEGGMTFEQAMQIGRWMPEDEKEGLLGVDMMTSKAMGLEDVDPRWTKLLEGGMSIETSEKLGVKQFNPAAVGHPAVEMRSKL